MITQQPSPRKETMAGLEIEHGLRRSSTLLWHRQIGSRTRLNVDWRLSIELGDKVPRTSGPTWGSLKPTNSVHPRSEDTARTHGDPCSVAIPLLRSLPSLQRGYIAVSGGTLSLPSEEKLEVRAFLSYAAGFVNDNSFVDSSISRLRRPKI